MKTRLQSSSKALLAAALMVIGTASARADSLWAPQFRTSLIGDKKAHAIGDIVTVVVQEANSATKDSSTSSSKNSSSDSSINSFFYSPGASSLLTRGSNSFPALKFSSKNDFQGGGQINNSETINIRFGVVVVDVLPNKNLVVEGMRRSTVAGDSRTVILRGVVRPYDVSPANTVLSFNLADVSITFKDSGSISASQRKGWFGRFWDVLTPF